MFDVAVNVAYCVGHKVDALVLRLTVHGNASVALARSVCDCDGLSAEGAGMEGGDGWGLTVVDVVLDVVAAFAGDAIAVMTSENTAIAVNTATNGVRNE